MVKEVDHGQLISPYNETEEVQGDGWFLPPDLTPSM